MDNDLAPKSSAVPREKIVVAAIGIIERDGLSKATTRAIAEAAGVNIAALNYYFGTKERVLNEAVSFALKEAFIRNMDELFPDGFALTRNHLKKLAYMLVRGGLQYPRLNRLPFQVEPGSELGKIVHTEVAAFLERIVQNLPKRPAVKVQPGAGLSFTFITTIIQLPAQAGLWAEFDGVAEDKVEAGLLALVDQMLEAAPESIEPD